jgi:hypothetical protein
VDKRNLPNVKVRSTRVKRGPRMLGGVGECGRGVAGECVRSKFRLIVSWLLRTYQTIFVTKKVRFVFMQYALAT